MYARDGTQLQPAAQPVDMKQPKKVGNLILCYVNQAIQASYYDVENGARGHPQN